VKDEQPDNNQLTDIATTKDLNRSGYNICICGKICKNNRGLKIHEGKKDSGGPGVILYTQLILVRQRREWSRNITTVTTLSMRLIKVEKA
jgi:hypothetical protein